MYDAEDVADRPHLDTTHTALYRQALEEGALDIDAVAAALGIDASLARRAAQDLVAEHLLVTDPQDEALVPASPDVAAALSVGRLEAEIQERRAKVARIRANLSEIMPVYEAAIRRNSMSGDARKLTSVDAIRGELTRLSGQSKFEVSAAHPVLPPPEALEEGVIRTQETIARGISMRTIYPHSVLAHKYMQSHLTSMVQVGAEVRTTGHIVDRAIFFDRKHAVLSHLGSENGGEAILVDSPALVDFLYRSWKSMWLNSTPFTASNGEIGYGDVKREVRLTIVRLLDSGLKDEVVARKLGMSVRACRRHIAEIMEELGADSRFQAGSYARKTGWLD